MERIPILRMGEFVLVTIQVDMHDRLALALQDDLANAVSRTGARGVLIDISSLTMVDSFIGRMLSNLSAIARIMDAETVVVGMQPAVAITLVELGLTLPRHPNGFERGPRHEHVARRIEPGARLTIMASVKEHIVVLAAQADVVIARQTVRQWAADIQLNLVDQTKIVTAASELARNTLVHGGGGIMRLQVLAEGPRTGLRLIFEDQGPGIPDVQLAMRDGYTTGTGLGLGLGGSKRLVSEFEIQSKPGAGTRVTVTRWK